MIEPRDFFYAISEGDLETIEVALKSGFDLKVMNSAGETPIVYATLRGEVQIIKALLAASTMAIEDLPMLEAAIPDDTSVLDYFLSLGADPDAAIGGAGTALMEAAGGGNLAAMRVLRAHGANPSWKSEAGFGALDAARLQDQQEAIAFLTDWIKETS